MLQVSVLVVLLCAILKKHREIPHIPIDALDGDRRHVVRIGVVPRNLFVADILLVIVHGVVDLALHWELRVPVRFGDVVVFQEELVVGVCASYVIRDLDVVLNPLLRILERELHVRIVDTV